MMRYFENIFAKEKVAQGSIDATHLRKQSIWRKISQMSLSILVICGLLMGVVIKGYSQQNVAINEDNSLPNASAIVDIQSTTKGVLFPRMTLTETTGISSPIPGLLVYSTTNQDFYFYNGSVWSVVKTGTEDNFGNHQATETLRLNGTWLSNDGGSEGIRIASNGQVGIGTSATNQALSLNGLVYTSTGVEMGGMGRYIGSNIYFEGTWTYRADGEAWVIRHGTSGLMEFYTASSGTAGSSATIALRMAIKNTGQVGIGLNNPLTRLQVRNSTDLSIGWTPETHNTTLLEGTSAGSVLSLISGNTGESSIYLGDNDLETSGRLQYDHNLNTMSFGTNNATRMIIDANGNVGIGDDTPAGPLEVRTSSTTTEALIAQFTSGSNQTLQLLQPDNANNDDYFTFLTNNAFQFRVDGTDGLSIEPDGSVKVGPYTLPKTDGSNGQVLQTDGSGSVSWGNGTGDDLGNHIATSNVQLSGRYLSNDGGNEGVYVDTDGNVGIGTNAPAGLFDIEYVDNTLFTGESSSTRNSAFSGSYGVTQTFTAETTGGLNSIYLFFFNPGSKNFTFSLYEGSGTGGTLLVSQSAAVFGSGFQTIQISLSGVTLVVGQVYTFYVSNGKSILYANDESAYTGGESSFSGGDISFSTLRTTSNSVTIQGSGGIKMGINNTSPSVALDVGGYIEYTGTITDVSDHRLKTAFKPIENALDRLKKLQGYTYHMKNDPKKEREYGVIAQDVQKVFPEMVKVIDKDKGYLGVSYIQLIPVILEAIKTQDEKIETITKSTQALKKRAKTLKALKKQLGDPQDFKNRLEQIEAQLGLKAKK
ncbi:MAG TPA: hypothetical protein DCS93_19580 [Microscillaceae bacterium]|nr:hypothetical protein [Microscillaceae bacterium]